MIRKCIICKRVRSVADGISLFRFPPRSSLKFERWADAVNLPCDKVTGSTMVCSIHFSRDSFKTFSTFKQTLTENALPSERFYENIPPYVPPLVEQKQSYLERMRAEQELNSEQKLNQEQKLKPPSASTPNFHTVIVRPDPSIECLNAERLSPPHHQPDANMEVEHVPMETAECAAKTTVVNDQNAWTPSARKKSKRKKESAIISRLKAKIKQKNRIILKLFSRIVRMKIRRDKNFIRRLFKKQQHLFQ